MNSKRKWWVMKTIFAYWDKFWQEWVRLVLFFSILFLLERVLFFCYYSEYVPTDWAEVLKSLVLGTRMSLMTLLIPSLLGAVLFLFPYGEKLRNYFVYLCLPVMILLFLGRFPYYNNFQSNYNSNLFEGMNENIFSLLVSIGSWDTWLTLVVAGFLLFVLDYKIWILINKISRIDFSNKNPFLRIFSLLIVVGLFLLCRYGGAFSSADRLRWQNVAQTSSEFLNETIMDEVQALIRAKTQYEAAHNSIQMMLDSNQMIKYGKLINPKELTNSNQIDNYLVREATGAKIPKPQHIFLVIGESYGKWPLSNKYNNWHLADGMRSIIDLPNTAHIDNILPVGNFTHYAVVGITSGVLGLQEDATYFPESYSGAFKTAIAPQMKKLGYNTHFWYGGPGSWQQIGKYTVAQGFDKFHGSGEMGLRTDNAWGAKDQEFFDHILGEIPTNQNTFHVILPTANHPPFSIDLKKEGFDEERLKRALPVDLQNDQQLINRLGHFWYADREITRFITTTKEKYPDSLFIVVGDHGTRTEMESLLTMWERETVPLIIYGPGIRKEMFPVGNAGNQIQIISTLMELLAPKGEEYYSLMPSLTEKSEEGTSYQYWIVNGEIGNRLTGKSEKFTAPGEAGKRNKDKEDAVISFSWWRLNRGKHW